MSRRIEDLDKLIEKSTTNTNSSGLVFVLNDNHIIHEWWPLIKKQFLNGHEFIIHGSKYKPERIVFDNKSTLHIFSNDNPYKAFASNYDWFFIGEPIALNILRNGIIELLEDRCRHSKIT